MRNLSFAVLVFMTFFLVSCETTQSGYGYIAEEFDDYAIEELMALSDESINERQFEIYSGLFAPGYYIYDKSNRGMSMNNPRIGRLEYLNQVEEIFDRAKEIVYYTSITDIDYLEPGRTAKVTVQEDGVMDFLGQRERMVSMIEYEIGFEDGWIYFNNATIIAKQEIKD